MFSRQEIEWSIVPPGREVDVFVRLSETMAPILTPPFYAAELRLAIVNTQGGPRHNKFARPLTLMRETRSPGSTHRASWVRFSDISIRGGSNLAEVQAFGRLAGECAVRETPW